MEILKLSLFFGAVKVKTWYGCKKKSQQIASYRSNFNQFYMILKELQNDELIFLILITRKQ